VTIRNRRSRRKQSQVRKNWEKLKEVANASARGVEWIVLFLGLLVSIAGTLVAFLAGATVYAVLLFFFALLVGAALLKREAG
jgi:membrane protein YqaA with SNARE-associated domain